MSEQRRLVLDKNIKEAYEVISESESMLLLSESPKERIRLKRDIEDTREQIAQFEAELEKLEAASGGKSSGGGGGGGPQRLCPTPPAAPDNFGGRADDLAEMKARLKATKSTSLISIQGLGGIGKTTLARQLAHDLFYEDRVFRAVLWADITLNPNPLSLLVSWAAYADDTFTPGNQPLPQLARQVKSMLEALIKEACEECDPSRVLVVMDDVWDTGIDTVRLLREACPVDSTVMLTSRSNALAIRLGAQNLALSRLATDEGVHLLQTYMPSADPIGLAQLTEVLGGHPLALALAAKRILSKANPTKALTEQVEAYRSGLASGADFSKLKLEQGEGREDNLTLALSYSLSELGPDDQARFRALGVLAYNQPFSLDLLADLWDVDPSDVEDYCDHLRLLSLLDVDTGTSSNYGDGWYRQHPLLQSYALALLKSLPEQAEVRRRYEDHMISFSEKFTELPPEAWGELIPHLPHVHAVGESLVGQVASGQADEKLMRRALNFTVSVRRYLDKRREVRQPQWLEMGLNLSRKLNEKREEAVFLNILGLVNSGLGDKNQALAHFEAALPICRELGDTDEEANTLNNIGRVYADLGENAQAVGYFEQALPLSRNAGDKTGEATTLNDIGWIYADWGDETNALMYYEQALGLWGAVEDQGGKADTLNNLGRVYADQGKHQAALEKYEEALKLYQAVGDQGGQAATLNNIGLSHAAMDAHVQMMAYVEKQLPMLKAEGVENFDQTLSFVGKVRRITEEAPALGYYRQALELFQKVGEPVGEAQTLNNIGQVHAVQYQHEQALECYNQALELFRTASDRGGEATILTNIGRVYARQSQNQKALEFYQQALPLYGAVDDWSGEANALTNIGRVYSKMNHKEQALDYYQQALPFLQAVGNQLTEATVLNNAGILYWQLGEQEKGKEMLEQALTVFKTIESPAAEVVEEALVQMQEGNSPENFSE